MIDKFIIWLSNCKEYFQWKKTSCYPKVELARHKLIYGAEGWWLDVLEDKVHVGKSILPSFKQLNHLRTNHY